MKEDRRKKKSRNPRYLLKCAKLIFICFHIPPIFFFYFYILSKKKILLAQNLAYEREKNRELNKKTGKFFFVSKTRRVFISPQRGTNKQQEKKLKIVLVNEKERRRFLSVPLYKGLVNIFLCLKVKLNKEEIYTSFNRAKASTTGKI